MFKRKLTTHILTLACLFGTGYTFTDETAQGTSLIDYISNQYLISNFGEEKPVEVMPTSIEKLTVLEKIKKNIDKQYNLFDVEKQILTDKDAQKTCFELIKPFFTATSIVDSSVIDKLEIINGGENKALRLVATLFNDTVYTKLGKAYTALTMCLPTTNLKIIKNRQNAIHLLRTNPDTIQELNAIFTMIKNTENKALTYYSQTPILQENHLNSFYFNMGPLKKLNANTPALELSIRTNSMMYTAFAGVIPGALLTGIHFASKAMDCSYIQTIKTAMTGCANLIKSSDVPLKYKIFGTSYGMLAFLSVPILAYVAKKQITSTAEGTAHLQDILIATSEQIKQLHALSTFINKNEELVQLLPSLQHLADFNDTKKHSAKLNTLLNMLNTNTFKGEPSFWSVTGRILAAHTLIHQVKDELAPVFAAAGELDMYVALAKLYNSREGKEAQYCMVNFVENSATPVIDAQNFWNPFINPDTVVINNATFDTSCPNSILTGPNTGGKSTVIRGIIINILMAQTFGIAPSSSLTLTPFSKLNCFMNISDDIATGASLFKSEVMRAKKLLDMVQGLKENEFSFVIIDEVFTGTSPQEGEMAALRFAKKLGSYTNNTSIIATHYPKMVNLHEETNGMFHNHHVEILRNEDGSLNRTFKFKNGPSFFNVAFDILEEEGLFV